METRANYAMIGLFTLAVIAAAFMFVFWFSGGANKQGLKSYRVVFDSSVSGLSRGANVLFNGLRVGEVKEIDLVEDQPNKVYAVIAVNARTPIKTDTKAQLEFQGLTGVASIALSGGSPGANDLVAKGGKMPVINADRSDFQNIVNILQKLATRADSTLGKLDKLIADNSQSFSNTVKNVEKFSNALADNSDGVKDFMASISELGKTLKPVVANIEELTKNLNTRIAAVDPEKLKSMMENADKTIAQISGAVGKIEKLVNENSNSVASTIKNAQEFTKTLADNKENIRTALADLSKLGKQLEPVIKSVEEMTKTIDSRVKAVDPEKVKSIVASIDQAVGQFDKLFKDNSKPLTATLKNMEEFTKTLADNKDGVNKLIATLGDLGKTLEPTIKNIEKLSTDIGKRVDAVDPKKVEEIVANTGKLTKTLNGSADKLDKVLTSLNKVLGSDNANGVMKEVTETAKAIRTLARNLDKRTAELTRGIARFTGPGLRKYEALAADGRRTLRQVNKTLRSLQKNPQQVIFGSKPAIPEYSGR